MIINVPLCNLPNSPVQEFDMQTCKLTLFQIDQLVEISQRDDFEDFLCKSDGAVVRLLPEYSGPINVTWYSKTGQLNMIRIGKNKILRQRPPTIDRSD